MVQVENFLIDVYEFPNQHGEMPRVDVTWEEASALCQARGKRLCAESEWEQACLGSQGYLYGYGPTFEPGRCNTPYEMDGVWQRTAGPLPSGALADCAGPSGIHDMIGNVWEWTDGWYDKTRGWRVVRGGSWFNSANFATANGRYGLFLRSDYRLDLIGFRCCRSVPTAPSTPP
jgi:formylglycine-generating enzyme required for sulfatase activity